jgi:uncharacterized repeat protein (TIGR01451 family)
MIAVTAIWGCEKPAAEPDKQTDNATIITSGHLSSDVAKTGESIRFWIMLENRSGAPLQNVRLADLDTPGFRYTEGCWRSGAQIPSCVSPEMNPSCSASDKPVPQQQPLDQFALCQYLRPAESLTVWGDLLATDWMLPAHRQYAVLSWSNPSDPKSKQSMETRSLRLVSLGTADAVWPYAHWLLWLAKPEVVLPGLFGLFGYFIAARSKKLEQRNNIRATMLTSAHEEVMHYHMPTLTALSAAIFFIDQVNTSVGTKTTLVPGGLAPDVRQHARRGFFYLTLFHWWQRRTFNKVGGYHLSNVAGEQLLLLTSNMHRNLFGLNEEKARIQLMSMIQFFTRETTEFDFLSKLDGGDPIIVDRWNDFVSYLGTEHSARDASILEAHAQVFLYEANAIHAGWYTTPIRLILSSRADSVVHEVERTLNTADPGARKTKSEIRKYLLRTSPSLLKRLISSVVP